MDEKQRLRERLRAKIRAKSNQRKRGCQPSYDPSLKMSRTEQRKAKRLVKKNGGPDQVMHTMAQQLAQTTGMPYEKLRDIIQTVVSTAPNPQDIQPRLWEAIQKLQAQEQPQETPQETPVTQEQPQEETPVTIATKPIKPLRD